MAKKTEDIVGVFGSRAEEEASAGELYIQVSVMIAKHLVGSSLTLAGRIRLCGQFNAFAPRPPAPEARFFVVLLNEASRASYVKYWSSTALSAIPGKYARALLVSTRRSSLGCGVAARDAMGIELVLEAADHSRYIEDPGV
jgi:hypothetical protein